MNHEDAKTRYEEIISGIEKLHETIFKLHIRNFLYYMIIMGLLRHLNSDRVTLITVICATFIQLCIDPLLSVIIEALRKRRKDRV